MNSWLFFYSPLDGMLVRGRVTPSSKLSGGGGRYHESKVSCPRKQRSAGPELQARMLGLKELCHDILIHFFDGPNYC